jgi:hypothetical protein
MAGGHGDELRDAECDEAEGGLAVVSLLLPRLLDLGGRGGVFDIVEDEKGVFGDMGREGLL